MKFYWNQENFELLPQIASRLRTDARLTEMAEYCELRAQGLRKQALQKGRAFVLKYAALEPDEQRHIALWLFELSHEFQQAHWFIPHPVKEALIIAVGTWREEEVDNARAHRLYGWLTKDMEAFEKAIELDPKDEFSRISLIQWLDASIWNSTHHLPDYFIGEPGELLELAEYVESLLEAMAPGKAKDSLSKEVLEDKQKVLDWVVFCESGEEDFGQWCKSNRGYTWDQISAVYYDKK